MRVIWDLNRSYYNPTISWATRFQLFVFESYLYLKCIESEYKEFEDAVKSGNKDLMEDEMGDIFFATVNLARWYKIDAEQALLRANKKFTKRFKKMEELAVKPLEDYSFEEYDKLWKQAKIEIEKEEQKWKNYSV